MVRCRDTAAVATGVTAAAPGAGSYGPGAGGRVLARTAVIRLDPGLPAGSSAWDAATAEQSLGHHCVSQGIKARPRGQRVRTQPNARGRGAPEPSPRGRVATGAAGSLVRGRSGSRETGTRSVKIVSVSLGPTRQGRRKGVSTRQQRGGRWALGASQCSGSPPGWTVGRPPDSRRVHDALTQPAHCTSERGARGRWGDGPGRAS